MSWILPVCLLLVLQIPPPFSDLATARSVSTQPTSKQAVTQPTTRPMNYSFPPPVTIQPATSLAAPLKDSYFPPSSQAATRSSTNPATTQSTTTHSTTRQASTNPSTTQAATSPSPTTQASTTTPSTTQASTSPSTTEASATSPSTTQSSTNPSTTQATTNPTWPRYFGELLDERSKFGKNFFPNPLLAPSWDASNQIQLQYSHTEDRSTKQDMANFSVEHNFAFLTLTFGCDYTRSHTSIVPESTIYGAGPVIFAAQHPLFQFISDDQKFDSTFGGRVEVGLPGGSAVSKDTTLRFDAYELIRVGDHFSFQGSVGALHFVGPLYGGTTEVPWDLTFAYKLPKSELPLLPFVDATTPMLEINGQAPLSGSSVGSHPINGILGSWFDFPQKGSFQPKLGLGYLLPINKAARASQDWGVVVNLVFGY